jgi:hypothetical protein
MADSTKAPAAEPTKTEKMIAAARTVKGKTVEELMEVTGQTKQIVRSRLHTLGKRGLIAPVDGSSPRRYSSKGLPKKES